MLTYARVNDGEGVICLVGDDVYVEFGVGFEQVLLLVLEALKLDLVQGIAGVGDQFSQENFLCSALHFSGMHPGL